MRVQQSLRETCPGDQGGDLLQSEGGALQLLGLVERRRLALLQLAEFLLDIAKISLQVLFNRTGITIPFRTDIGVGRETVIPSAEKVPSEGKFHDGHT